MRILCAGDQFISPDLLIESLQAELGDAHDYVTDESDWPVQPFSDEGEVREWAGDVSRLGKLVADVDAVVTHVAPITGSVLAAAPQLRLVGCCRGGPVNINVEEATRRGVLVTRAPGRNATATAEFSIALVLAGLRRLTAASDALRGGDWSERFYTYTGAGEQLHGRTVGVVGMGKVGSRVVRMLAGFEVRVLVHDPYVDTEAILEAGAFPVDFDTLLDESDLVTLHARLTEETTGMVDERALRRLRQGAFLVNAARGPLVDENALVAALSNGHLAGAALDVFVREPLPADHSLRAFDTVTLTPHIAGSARESAIAGAAMIAGEVGRFTRGEALRWAVNEPAVAQRTNDGGLPRQV